MPSPLIQQCLIDGQLCVALALVCSALPIAEALGETPCVEIDLADGQPTRQEWSSAIGHSSKVRVARVQDSSTWLVAYEPQWTPDALLARPNPRPGEWLPSPGASAPYDTVRVAWENIVSLERHTRGLGRTGLLLGTVVGSWVAAPLLVLCKVGGCSGEQALLLLLIVPASTIAGGLVAGRADWTPMLCDGGSDDMQSGSAGSARPSRQEVVEGPQ
jgi:hypothetical protein